jgi:hypothetical protein
VVLYLVGRRTARGPEPVAAASTGLAGPES